MEFRLLMLVLQNNIDDISCLISQSLDLTRSLDTEEAPTRMELTSFVLSIVDDNAETGTRVSMPRQVRVPESNGSDDRYSPDVRWRHQNPSLPDGLRRWQLFLP